MNMKHETTPPAPEIIQITEAVVMEYAAVSKQYTELGKIREELNERIKLALLTGQECPTTAPYVLALQPQQRCVWSVKEIMDAVLNVLPMRAKDMAVRVINNLSDQKTTIYSLRVEVNSAYEAVTMKTFGAGSGGDHDI